MEDFNLIIKDLISKDLDSLKLEIPESLKMEFEKTADNYIKNGNLLEAIKVFVITKNKQRLIQTANLCLKENKPYDALCGFYYSEDVESLNKVGFILLQIPDVESAFKAFKKANNREMIDFLKTNF